MGPKIKYCHHPEQCDHYFWRHPSHQELLGGPSMTTVPTAPAASHNAVLATVADQQTDRQSESTDITVNRGVGEDHVYHLLKVRNGCKPNSQRSKSTDDRSHHIVHVENGSKRYHHRHGQDGEFDSNNAVVLDTFSIDLAPSYWPIKRVES